jgi:uncharacterized protein (TIGR04255 family)
MAEQAQPYTRSLDLPLFERPPVTEVTIGLQVQGVRFRAVHLGALSAQYADRYPVVEERLPSPLQIEQFERKSPSGIHFQFQLLDRPPLPMVVFLAEDRSRLIQIDDSRFFWAWRRSAEEIEYPRYEMFREEFIRDANIYDDFTTEVGITNQAVTQAEIVYVNDIPMSEGPRPDMLAHVLPAFATRDMESAEEISTVSTSQHFTYKTQPGIDYARLHITAEPAVVDSEPVLRLSLVYRGEPHEQFAGESLADIMRFLDQGHDRIVRAFAANTTPEAQQEWGRVQ